MTLDSLQQRQWLQDYESEGLGISILSCCKVAKLVEKKRINLPLVVDKWLEVALAYYGVQLLSLFLPIVIDATQLSGFHNDLFD
ncbi:hypothetical protein [uncultured Nostoc sp.]|uniref:hypothetical protein n=1 Tax=uncultured Nostoc sp. TaxID=340711 RepID=UPI0035CB43F7